MITITGKVYGDAGEEIPFANIEVVNEKRYGTADSNGFFSVQANSVNSVLKFSHVAYVWDTISVSEFQKTKRIVLFIDNNQLDEVVIPPKPKPKTDNTLYWVLGILIVGGIVISVSGSKEDKEDKEA